MPNEKTITVEFKDGKKILTHPTGEKKEYTQEQLEKAKELLTARRQEMDEHIASIDDDLKNIALAKPQEKTPDA